MSEKPQLPKVKELKGKFQSLIDALNNTSHVELGPKYYPKARKMTLALNSTPPDLDMLSKLSLKELEEKRKSLPIENEETEREEEEEVLAEPSREQLEQSESTEVQIDEASGTAKIETLEDLSAVLMGLIHEVFYNPETGFWPSYDRDFDKEPFTKLGKPGWDSPEDTPQRLTAREEINRKKKKELSKLMKEKFISKSVDHVYEAIQKQVIGVKRREVKLAVKNHVRFHLYHLVFDDQR